MYFALIYEWKLSTDENLYIKIHQIYIEFENKMTHPYENQIHEHKISLP